MKVILPYLLLVTFFSGNLTNFNLTKIQAINASPYQGVAVPVCGPYDTGTISAKDFAKAIKRLKENSGKHVWPWVFLNRIIGYENQAPAHSTSANQPYYRNIQGMALAQGSKPLEDFYGIWKLALKSAKEMGAPGIILDIEPYNNYRSNRLPYLVQKMHMTKPVLIARLRQIGAHLCDETDRIYPGAVIWCLYTGVGSPLRGELPFTQEYRPGTYIIFGMLKEAAKKDSKMVLVSGGEMSLGYCNIDLQDLKTRIVRRQKIFAPLLARFPQLKLGGTIAPWRDINYRKKWMLKFKGCANSKLKTAEDFRPLLKELLASYPYVWVYAAGAAHYNPFDKSTAKIYNKAFEGLP